MVLQHSVQVVCIIIVIVTVEMPDANKPKQHALPIAKAVTCTTTIMCTIRATFISDVQPPRKSGACNLYLVDIKSTRRRSARGGALGVPIFKSQRALYSPLKAKWGEEYGNTTLLSGGMKFADGGRAVENKILNAVVEQRSFRVAFTGMKIDNALARAAMRYAIIITAFRST